MAEQAWARQQQLEQGPVDDQLTLQARLRHPGAKHWWGRRASSEGGAGAYCYLCDSFVSSWAAKWPITEQARIVVHMHRSHHIATHLAGGDTPQESTA